MPEQLLQLQVYCDISLEQFLQLPIAGYPIRIHKNVTNTAIQNDFSINFPTIREENASLMFSNVYPAIPFIVEIFPSTKPNNTSIHNGTILISSKIENDGNIIQPASFFRCLFIFTPAL